MLMCAPTERVGAMSPRSEATTALSQPKKSDPMWREKIETAKRARAAALAARRGKPSSFRPLSGYRAS